MRNVMLVPEGVRSKTIMEDKLLDVIFKVSQVPAPTTNGKVSRSTSRRERS